MFRFNPVNIIKWMVIFLTPFILCTCTKEHLDLPNILKINGHILFVKPAITEREKSQGLKNCKKLADDHGMLFLFQKPADICVWMEDTQIPLSVAFVDGHGVIVNIADMEPLSKIEHCSARPAKFVIEVQQGWFTAHDVTPGLLIGGLAPQ